MFRVVHFEIGADDIGKISKFYADVFGWKMQKWGEGEQEYILVSTGDEKDMGINGGIFKHKEGGPAIINTISVANLDEMCKKVEASGGTIITQKMTIPGVGWMAYFKDIEGNQSGMLQPDAAAK